MRPQWGWSLSWVTGSWTLDSPQQRAWATPPHSGSCPAGSFPVPSEQTCPLGAGELGSRACFSLCWEPGALLWPLLTSRPSCRPWSCPTPSPPSSVPCWRGSCRGMSTGDWAAWAEGECRDQGYCPRAAVSRPLPWAAGLCLCPPGDKGCVPSLEPASFEELTGGWGTASSARSKLRVAAAGAGW